MDIVMPDMSGVDALREIVKVDPNARVLMCTAIGQEKLVSQAREIGARGFIIKPFKPSGFLDALNEVL